VLSEQFVDFAELFAEDWKVVPWYGVFATEVSERPLSQATPFFIVNELRALATCGPFADGPVREDASPLPQEVAAAV